MCQPWKFRFERLVRLDIGAWLHQGGWKFGNSELVLLLPSQPVCPTDDHATATRCYPSSSSSATAAAAAAAAAAESQSATTDSNAAAALS